MELKFDIGIKQLIKLIQQLPVEQKLKIKQAVDKDISNANKEVEDNDLKQLLLNGPTMTEAEAERFKKFNQGFEQWTKSLFA